ncbi:hypothetical protein AC244_22370 [Ensifer adhaerens]|uniref:Uncharacterized protein n=1 Tax=Ensifer adhaerens TaxID=106592 RepID=A0A0L8BLQ6_ENSAD|nr:hypothetical protein [Ensifer adhaerens]KOF15520.1 hypothetical protein AC244_22370 [Ensifer adhaerens]
MAIHFDQSGFEIAPDQIDLLQKIFDQICFEAHISRQDVRAGRLAKFLMDELRVGNADELALIECGRWFCRRAGSTHGRSYEQHRMRTEH